MSQHGNLNLGVYMTDDTADVYEDKFLDAANDGRGSFRPTLILIGTRLGIDRITPVYWDAVKTTLQLPQSVGIAGYVITQRSKISGPVVTKSAVDAHQHRITLSVFKARTYFTLTPIRLAQRCHSAISMTHTQMKR